MALSKRGPVFSLTDVAVKKPADAAGTWVDIPAVTSAAFKGTVTEVELTGDNAILGILRHSQKGQLVVKASYAAMDVLEKVSGNVGSSTGSVETLDFGTDGELNPPVLAVRALMPVNRVDGNGTGTLSVYFYNAQVSTAFESFPGASFGALGEVTLTFNCYKSGVDENNAALAGGKRVLGRIDFIN
jgi:hypothetical protein